MMINQLNYDSMGTYNHINTTDENEPYSNQIFLLNHQIPYRGRSANLPPEINRELNSIQTLNHKFDHRFS